MLEALGFRVAAELTLRISDIWAPVPDVAGVLDFQKGVIYQGEPPAVIIEILSPTDSFSLLHRVQEILRVGHARRSGIRPGHAAGLVLGPRPEQPDSGRRKLPLPVTGC
jgi:hypothetical protein